MKKCVQITVSGKVQGVFFRASAREQAEALRLGGFVRNEDNGDVYLEAEGDSDSIDKLIAWCKTGPVHSQVDHVQAVETTTKGYEKFKIVR